MLEAGCLLVGDMSVGVHTILHLIDSAGMYGAEKVIVNLLDELNDSEFTGILGCICEDSEAKPEIGKIAEEKGISVEYFPMKRGLSAKGIRHIREYVLKNAIGIIHSHGYKPNIFTTLMPRKDVKLISTVHGWSKHTGNWKTRIYEFFDSLALGRMDHIVAVSRGVRADLESRTVDSEKVVVIYNGIPQLDYWNDSQSNHNRERYGCRPEAFIIAVVGRLSTVKGHRYLIDAMPAILKTHRNCQLVIAGEGPLREEYEKHIAALGLEKDVRLVGYVQDVVSFMGNVDLFVLPSLSEGLPIALLEAMACKKAIVASAVGGVPEVITDGQEGILVAPGDSLALSEAIIALLRDKAEMTRLGLNAKRHVEMKFLSSQMASGYCDLYRNVLKASSLS